MATGEEQTGKEEADSSVEKTARWIEGYVARWFCFFAVFAVLYALARPLPPDGRDFVSRGLIYAAGALAVWLACFLAGLTLSLLGVLLARRKEGRSRALWGGGLWAALLPALGILYVNWAAPTIRQENPVRATQRDNRVAPAPVIVAITAEDAGGVTEADLDLPGLKKLESRLLQMTIDKARASYATRGLDPNTFKPTVESSSVYMTVGGRKLAVVKATMNAEVRAVWIVGLNDDQFVRVTCLRSSNHDISLFSGECAAKITEAFGVSVRP